MQRTANISLSKASSQSLQRVTRKGQHALIQLQKQLRREIEEHGDNYGAKIIDEFIYISAYPTLSLLQKSSLIRVFEHITYVIKLNKDLNGYILQLMNSILKYFNDPSYKVRYDAISSIYNVLKFLDEDCLVIFTRIFKELPCIITDPSAEVQQAALHLNHTMKTLLNNAMLDNRDFNYQNFIQILTENFLLPHPKVKEFLIDWINTLDEIKTFESTHFLPIFLKKLFIFLVDDNKNVRSKAEDCLKGFIDSFRLSFTCQRENISIRYTLEDTQAILELLVNIIKESIIFEVSSKIDIHVLDWLDNFSLFLVQEINLHLSPFLAVIFARIFPNLLKIMIETMSIDNDNIRKTSARIHENLMKAYPTLCDRNPLIRECACIFKQALFIADHELKTLIMIKWISLMGSHSDNEIIAADMETYLINIVAKLCEGPESRASAIFYLLNDSIFTRIYLSQLVRSLIIHLHLKKKSQPFQVIRRFMYLSSPSETFMLICQQINNLKYLRDSPYKLRMAEILLHNLITEPDLADLRESFRSHKASKSIIVEITRLFAQNESTFIGFCFLVGHYSLVSCIIDELSYCEFDHRLLLSMTKTSNLLLHPSMHSLFFDIHNQSRMDTATQARNAYLSVIMLLPMNKYTLGLHYRIDFLPEEWEWEQGRDSEGQDTNQTSEYEVLPAESLNQFPGDSTEFFKLIAQIRQQFHDQKHTNQIESICNETIEYIVQEDQL